MSDEEAPGGPILRHKGPPREGELAAGDGASIEAISAHIERYVGPVHMVYHEIVSPMVHVDIHHVAPAEDRPCHVLVTTGMSDRPMAVPSGAESFRFAELFVVLPAEWPISQQAFENEANYWPIRMLKMLARLPHQYETWLGLGHTVGNGEPPRPYADSTRLCGALVVPPLAVPGDFGTLTMGDGRTVRFWQVMPLYQEEMSFKIANGVEALLDRFDSQATPSIVSVKRANVCRSRFRFWS